MNNLWKELINHEWNNEFLKHLSLHFQKMMAKLFKKKQLLKIRRRKIKKILMKMKIKEII